MIYASDLDQTLIYSKQSMGDNEIPFTNVEIYLDKEISFISNEALSMLQRIAKEMLFVPVTTRTIEQYRRIHLFHDIIKPTYAITSNGGNILINDQPDMQWRHYIQEQLMDTALPMQEVLQHFSKIKQDEWIISERVADELFYVAVVQLDQIPLQEVVDFGVQLQQWGWHLSIQGRKIYFVPKAVSKHRAVQYVAEQTGASYLIASGDALLDKGLLELAHFAIAPSHGELFLQHQSATIHLPTVQFTQRSGILASEDILFAVWDKIKQASTS